MNVVYLIKNSAKYVEYEIRCLSTVLNGPRKQIPFVMMVMLAMMRCSDAQGQYGQPPVSVDFVESWVLSV